MGGHVERLKRRSEKRKRIMLNESHTSDTASLSSLTPNSKTDGMPSLCSPTPISPTLSSPTHSVPTPTHTIPTAGHCPYGHNEEPEQMLPHPEATLYDLVEGDSIYDTLSKDPAVSEDHAANILMALFRTGTDSVSN